MGLNLTAEKAFIFRITHRDNVRWILEHGIPCRNSQQVDPKFVDIGNLDLIGKRHLRSVPIAPFGTLSDYVPFYFTPHSPMLYNIKTGWAGIKRRNNEDVVILTSSLRLMNKKKINFIFTDRHAYLAAAQYYSDLGDLDQIDWAVIRSRDFRNDDLGRKERYEAEALIYRHVPIDSLLGIVCYDDDISTNMRANAVELGLSIEIITKPNWYFR